MAIEFTEITELPTPPTKASPASFAALADIFLAALPTMQTEVNVALVELNKLTSGLDQTEPIAAYSAATTYDFPDVCAGSDGHTYRCISTSVLADDPTASVTGDWLLLSFRPASSAETITGTDDESAVTPASLQAKVASTTAKGIVEIATDAEIETGTDAERVVTPSGLEANRVNLNKVAVISTRSTPGTWSISVLEPGVPVYLVTSSTLTFSVTSGTAEAGATSFVIGNAGPPGAVLIPTLNTIALNVTAAGGTTRAYHAYEWIP